MDEPGRASREDQRSVVQHLPVAGEDVLIELVGAEAVDLVIEVLLEIWKRREAVRGLKLTYEAPFLRHFTARLEPLA